jgi:hypothetical protein
MADFKDFGQLGQGGFAVVHKCAQESDGSLFAKKRDGVSAQIP